MDQSQIILKVDGMTCAGCARSVEQAIAEKGGENISVNLADKEVVFSSNASVNVDEVKENIIKRGYNILADESSEKKKD